MQTTLDFTRRTLGIDATSSLQDTEWFHDVFRRDVLKVDLEPVPDTSFAFKSAIRALPDLAVSRTYCSPMVSRRRKQATADDALFLALVLNGEARLLHTGTSSMHISVHVRSGDPATGELELTTHCLIIFVALDAAGAAVPAPDWVPVTDEDRALESHAVHLASLREAVHRRWPI